MAFSEANSFAEKIMRALLNKEIYIDHELREFRSSDGAIEIVI